MLALCGGLMAAGFALLPWTAAGGPGAGLLIPAAALFAAYGAAVRTVLRAGGPPDRAVPRIIVGLAILFRAVLLFAPPVLSNDIERYLWDGRVVLSGENPFLHPPEADALRHLRDESYERLDHRSIRTIYPPAGQAVFAAAAGLDAGWFGLKLLLILADLLGLAALRRVLARRGLPPSRLLIYAWNPLAVIEIAWSGHLEPVGMLCVLVAAGAIIQERDLRATLALALGALVKILPLLLFVPMLRAIRRRVLALVPLVLAVAYWPFRDAGAHLLSGAREYASRWVANESIFGLVRAGLEAIDPAPALKGAIALASRLLPGGASPDVLYGFVHPGELARGACALAAALVGAALVWRRVEPLRGLFVMTGALLLLSPTLHPWYLLWILPWLSLFPSPAWLSLSGLVLLSYLNAGVPREAEPYPWIRWIEYLPFYALLAREGIVAARVRRRAAALSRPVPDRMVDSPR